MNEHILELTDARYTSYDQLPLTLTAPQAANVIGISVPNMYKLMHSSEFPTTIIGKRMLVKKDALLKYIDAHTQRVSFQSE